MLLSASQIPRQYCGKRAVSFPREKSISLSNTIAAFQLKQITTSNNLETMIKIVKNCLNTPTFILYIIDPYEDCNLSNFLHTIINKKYRKLALLDFKYANFCLNSPFN